jgi:hypothetical protein
VLQLVYVSSVNPGVVVAIEAILATSQRNNARDGITGLLYADRARFLQALEGPAAAVEAAFARIQADPRHRAIVALSRREIEVREFGSWNMAHRAPGSDADAFIAHVAMLAENASANIRATFEGFAQTRRGA